MAITVQHGIDELTTHADAVKWHIDVDGRLHIVGDKGNTASYNAGYWANVQQLGTPASRITAVATLHTNRSDGDDQNFLSFSADYADERNKEWAKYTPALSLGMTVIDAVAENFEQGGRYLLTFEKQD